MRVNFRVLGLIAQPQIQMTKTPSHAEDELKLCTNHAVMSKESLRLPIEHLLHLYMLDFCSSYVMHIVVGLQEHPN